MGFVGSVQVEGGGCGAMCAPSTQNHSLPCGYTFLSLPPPSLDLHRDLWHTCSFLNPLRGRRASSCNRAAWAWLQLLAACGAPDGAFLGRVASGPAPVFSGCAGPREQPRLYGSPCHLLQGFESTGSGTVPVMRCVRSGDTSPARVVLFGMLLTSSSGARSVRAPLQ